MCSGQLNDMEIAGIDQNKEFQDHRHQAVARKQSNDGTEKACTAVIELLECTPTYALMIHPKLELKKPETPR